MSEKVEDIAKKIMRHRNLEISIDATNNAVGRSMTLYNDEEQQFWIINKEATVVQYLCDFNGNPIPQTCFSEKTTLKGDGFSVPRDSRLGGLLIENHEGNFKFKTPVGESNIVILSRATYKPSPSTAVLATDIIMRLAFDPKIYSFQDITKILTLQIEINEAREQLGKATEKEAESLVQRIAMKEEEKRAYIDKAQNFIRKYAELRYQPVLDPRQEAIKRSRIFGGALIINGGPGTGKTTSLIQRIKFLISSSIEEYKPLTSSQKEVLLNQKTSWIFYSPNELLALFLRNSMKLEELIADSERVKVWTSHKNELVKAYGFVSNTKLPFMFYNKQSGSNLFKNKAQSINAIIQGLDQFYIGYQSEKLNKISGIDLAPFKWKNVGKSIQAYLRDQNTVKTIEELMRLYLNLNLNFIKGTDIIAEDYSSLIKIVASRIQVEIQKEPERVKELTEVMKKWRVDVQDPEEEGGDGGEETIIEVEVFGENEEVPTFDFEVAFFTKLKSLCRIHALKKFDKNARVSLRDRELVELIPEVLDQPEYDSLGQLAYFKKYFERINKGIVANILREIPMVYKKYRRAQMEEKSGNWNMTILGDLVKKDKNTRIHPDEQALLLCFVNQIILKISKSFPEQYTTISHPYAIGFKSHCKPVIGIDEATDFALIDLIAINSFAHPELSAVTLSGDLMQRMTPEGITSWEDFTKTVRNTEIKDLMVSYRQSPTLLSLAKAIYEKSTGKTAKYESYIARDIAEPKPLMLVSSDEDAKLEWIADRILEIYKAYGDSIPSVAIFLPEENQLEQFASKLGSMDTLADVGVLVKACRNGEVLGDKNTVRVFSVKVIKGLEFESVFFHNIDDLQKQHLSNELFLKYLYVGLSRATFYLGLTMSKALSKELSFITDKFDMTGKTWAL